MYIALFIFAVFPAYIPIRKLLTRKDINMFDICILFSTLYFWVIPVNDFLFVNLREDYIGHDSTAFAVCVYLNLLAIASRYADRKSKTPLHITYQLRKIADIKLKDHFLWFTLLYIIYMLLQITNYSDLDKNNLERNNNFFYGSDLPFIIKTFIRTFKPFFAILLIILFRIKTHSKFYTLLRYVELGIVLISLILGEKRFMLYCFIFLGLYYYALYRNKVKLVYLVGVVSTMLVMFLVVFPMSQSFRNYKQVAVVKSKDHSFSKVARGFVEEGVDEKKMQNVERYQSARSLNVYDALDFAAYRTDYRGDGELTKNVLKYLIPQGIKEDRYGNIMARLMHAVDVGESTLAWYVLDVGAFWGPLFALIHLTLWTLGVFSLGTYFNKYIRSYMFPLIIYSYMLNYVIGVEHVPAYDIQMYYSDYIWILGYAGIFFYLFKKSTHFYFAHEKNRVGRSLPN